MAEIPENGLSQAGWGGNTSSNEAMIREGKETDRPAPLLDKWKEKYGTAGGRNRNGANNSDRKNKDVEGAGGRERECSSSHLTSASGSESSVVGNDGAIAIGMNGSDAAASAKNDKAENVPTGASKGRSDSMDLLVKWFEAFWTREAHLSRMMDVDLRKYQQKKKKTSVIYLSLIQRSKWITIPTGQTTHYIRKLQQQYLANYIINKSRKIPCVFIIYLFKNLLCFH